MDTRENGVLEVSRGRAALAQSPADLPFEEKRVRAVLLTIGVISGTAMACKFTSNPDYDVALSFLRTQPKIALTYRLSLLGVGATELAAVLISVIGTTRPRWPPASRSAYWGNSVFCGSQLLSGE
jgi:hypothetical protein